MTEPTQIKHVHVPRAAKACLACRRQKTRCFPSNDSNSCLRCQSLSRPCSFLKDGGADSSSGGVNASTGSSGNNNRKRSISAIDTSTTIDGVNIIELDKNVKKILTLLQPKTHPITSLNRGEDDSTTTKHKSPFQTSPFTLISNSVSSQSSTIRQLFNPTNIKPTPPISVLTLEIITMKEAITLVDKFKECYGRWISLPNNITTEELINSIQISSPILLTSICVTSLRYQKQTNHDNKLYLDLIKQLKLELFQEISNPINSLEFLKALVILSVYGYSLSVSDFTIDPWFLSGIAVQKFLTLDVDSELLNLDNLHESLDLEQECEKLSNFRIWNHICLVHLVNCVFSSRMCVLDEIRLDQSRKSLDLSQATNFDGRIVSEISLQLLLYNYLQSGSTTTDLGNHFNTDFESFEQELNLWHEQWNYLFRQPTLQFVEFGYHYVYLVAMYHYQFGGDKKIDELDPEDEIKDKEVLKKFMYHSIRLIDHINGIKDIVYFLCLSDQIHLCTMYTTLLFIKLIKWSYKYAGLGQIDMLDLISKAKLIKEKFIQVSRETNDLAFTFATSIQEAIDLVLAEA